MPIFKDIKELHPENIPSIVFTFPVLKVIKFKDFKLLQSANRLSIYDTELVLKYGPNSIDSNLVHPPNILPINPIEFEVKLVKFNDVNE